MVRSAFQLGGAEVKTSDGYPGWKPNPSSPILKVAIESYKKLFGIEPKVKAIHAGLECGLFLEKYPHLDMFSTGPTLRGVHSPDERMHIPAVDKFWKHLLDEHTLSAFLQSPALSPVACEAVSCGTISVVIADSIE